MARSTHDVAHDVAPVSHHATKDNLPLAALTLIMTHTKQILKHVSVTKPVDLNGEEGGREIIRKSVEQVMLASAGCDSLMLWPTSQEKKEITHFCIVLNARIEIDVLADFRNPQIHDASIVSQAS